MASDEPRPVTNRIREMMGRITLTGPEIQRSREFSCAFTSAMREEYARLRLDAEQYYRNAQFYTGIQWIEWPNDPIVDPDLAMDIGL